MAFVSMCCEGERCLCGARAEHKVEETIFIDDPVPHRHPLTAYICHRHFWWLMGPAQDDCSEVGRLRTALRGVEVALARDENVDAAMRLVRHALAPSAGEEK